MSDLDSAIRKYLDAHKKYVPAVNQASKKLLKWLLGTFAANIISLIFATSLIKELLLSKAPEEAEKYIAPYYSILIIGAYLLLMWGWLFWMTKLVTDHKKNLEDALEAVISETAKTKNYMLEQRCEFAEQRIRLLEYDILKLSTRATQND